MMTQEDLMNGKIPTYEDILKLADTDPVLHNAINWFYKSGNITFPELLMTVVVFQHFTLQFLREGLQNLMLNSAIPAPISVKLDEDRCEHGMFFTGAGACPKCGG